MSSFPLHSVHWPGSSSGNCHPEGFTEDAGVPCPHPAPSPHRAPRCPWCKIQSTCTRFCLCPPPALLSSLSPRHSLYSGHVGLLTVLEPTSYDPATGPLHVLFFVHRSLFLQLLTVSVLVPASASSSERSSLVSLRRTAHCHSLPCLISSHSSQHPWTCRRFYLFAYCLLPLLEGQGEAFCLFGSQTVSRAPST